VEEKLEMERELDALGVELHDCRREREDLEAIAATLEVERIERSRSNQIEPSQWKPLKPSKYYGSATPAMEVSVLMITLIYA
jgi:hypothetical protein